MNGDETAPQEITMFRIALALTLALTAPALLATAESLEEWDERTTLEDDNTHTLDSYQADDTDGTEDLDDVDTGRTESLDSVETRRDESPEPPAAPAPSSTPALQQGNWEDQASRAKDRIAQAEARLSTANAAYAGMRARDYPRGHAAAQITAERQAAERALNDAWGHLAEIKQAAQDAGRPL